MTAVILVIPCFFLPSSFNLVCFPRPFSPATPSRGARIMMTCTKPLDLMQAPHSFEKPAPRHQAYASGTAHASQTKLVC